jgi:D-proline reductase (dithiol) PrdB
MFINIQRNKNRAIARLAGIFPFVANRLAAAYAPWESEDVPWTPVRKKLADSKIALVTTAGVHHSHQAPFNMSSPKGDPSYRILDGKTIGQDYTITHDYYDHRSADQDLNVVFPLERLVEMQSAGFIGEIAKRHYGFMGHIDGHLIRMLIEVKAPEVAAMLRAEQVDAVLLTPG